MIQNVEKDIYSLSYDDLIEIRLDFTKKREKLFWFQQKLMNGDIAGISTLFQISDWAKTQDIAHRIKIKKFNFEALVFGFLWFLHSIIYRIDKRNTVRRAN